MPKKPFNHLVQPNAGQVQAAKELLLLRASVQWHVAPGLDTEQISDVNGASGKKNGKWQVTTRADHSATVVSYLAVSATGRSAVKHSLCCISFTEQTQRYWVPDGYHLDHDQLGLKLVRDADGRDYHPGHWEQQELDLNDWVRAVCNSDELRDAANKRAAAHTILQAQFDKDLGTTRVTLWDSQRAGNCIAGSLAFAQALLGLEPSNLLPVNAPGVPALILKRTGEVRAMNAAWAAWERETLVSI